MKTILILFYILSLSITQEKEHTGKVSRVIDGDTFELKTSTGTFKVRLDGIDCPEDKQPFSKESKAFLSKFLNMDCKINQKGKDRYGRILGVLRIESVNINLLMVKEGYAWHFKKYSKDAALAEAEIKARENKKGLWKDSKPVAPWEWRKK
jgi:endonuclease YncB( thermonuclease family)